MIDWSTRALKLVEFNTVATGFCCMSNKVQNMHAYILAKYGDSLKLNYGLEAASDDLNYRKYIKLDAELSGEPIHQDGHS